MRGNAEKRVGVRVCSEKNRSVFILLLFLPDNLVFLEVFQLSRVMVKISLPIFVALFLLLTPMGTGKDIHLSESTNFCLFKNPLCFYNMDVLGYLQVLHQNQEYAQMAKFFYGPMKEQLGEKKLAIALADLDFGYALKRVGIKEMDAKNWSLTYQRTILGTQENFKIEAALVNDSCRVYLDDKKWDLLFNRL
ncbi:MAG: hypothetical protein RLZZ358_255 [Bacteroidota bacterium]